MKATGIVRRIDDLGSIDIPTEIMKAMRLKEGDVLEFFINENERTIILKSWQPMRVTKEETIAMFESLTRVEQEEFLLDLRDLME